MTDKYLMWEGKPVAMTMGAGLEIVCPENIGHWPSTVLVPPGTLGTEYIQLFTAGAAVVCVCEASLQCLFYLLEFFSSLALPDIPQMFEEHLFVVPPVDTKKHVLLQQNSPHLT